MNFQNKNTIKILMYLIKLKKNYKLDKNFLKKGKNRYNILYDIIIIIIRRNL